MKISDSGMWFITFTCFQWIPLFQITSCHDKIYKWFDVLKAKGHDITGYVIMPNHLHLLMYYAGGKQDLNTIIGNGKRFLAYDIVANLESLNRSDLLSRLKGGVSDRDEKKGQLHKVFNGSFDCKKCETFQFFLQKLDYIHANPVSKKWQLAKETVDYPHSSAYFYETGMPGIYSIAHYEMFMEAMGWW